MDGLQSLMGDAYKEDMTMEDVSAFFKGKKFADLSSGKYVDKDKFDNKVNELTNQLNDKNNELNSKLTDDEKTKKAYEDQNKEIARLQALLKENTVSSNRNVVESVMTSARESLGVKETDNDFTTFIDNITSEDGVKSKTIASYVAKLVKDSYEKGKKDATKDAMGNFGKQSGNGNGSVDPAIQSIGKRVAQSTKPKETYDYFKKQ